ncbi:MAG: methyltransferase domain-containing protein [Sulfuritalea sp.]|nr:methyltransferase domain-containing protein [Sulfuritalea sp.]
MPRRSDGTDFSLGPTTGELAAVAIEARLEWRSEQASHADCLLVPASALHADGRWIAAGEEVLQGGSPVQLDATPWCRPAGRPRIELDRGALRLPADLRPGRHYPAHLFGRAVGGPRDMQPVRLVDTGPGGRLLLDPNHPLAGRNPHLLLAPTPEAAASGSRLATLFDGPGMQAPPAVDGAWHFAPGALARRDEASDIAFYARPRLVQHLDARCRAAIGELYDRLLQPGTRVLDLMASHDSHLPPHADVELCGLGLNDEEMAANPRLAERVEQDLNACPLLPWPDAHFDALICTASIEYLVRPSEVLAELRRVLKPGGLLVITFSDRWFPTKAIAVWGRLHEFERLGLVLQLLQAAGFAGLHTETRRGLPRPADDTYYTQRTFADPLFAAWGYAPS